MLTSDAYLESFRSGIKPNTLMSVSEWSDAYRYLPQKGGSEAGKWRTDRTPYLREIMDCLSPSSPIEKVIFMKGAQIGATESGSNWVGYTSDQAPSSIMIVQPSGDAARKYSRQRLDPLFSDTPKLRGLLTEGKSKSANTMLLKEIPGGIIIIASAKSPTSLRSMPAKYLFLDEVDGYGAIKDEGDPISLAEARTKTFPRRKIYYVSTPTVEGKSRISQLFYEESDQRYYYLPCPFCQHFQKLVWSSIKWPESKPEEAYYVCENQSCLREIEEFHKPWMLENGKWVSSHPEIGNGTVAGFHLSGLYSPLGWFSWGQAAVQWTKSQKNLDKLMSFVNLYLGETWKTKTEAPEWERLYKDNRESYPVNTIPPEVLFLTVGCDVQKTRIEYEVIGWSDTRESWSIDYQVIEKDPNSDEAWDALDQLLQRTWTHPSGVNIPIKKMAIDTGYLTQKVYSWARKHPHQVIAIKGQDKLSVPVGQAKSVDVTYGGKTYANGLRLWPVGVSLLKHELYGLLMLKKPTNPKDPVPHGYCHFPEYQESYFRQLTAERVETRIIRGYSRYEWVKLGANEALDCRIYNMAAANVVGISRFEKAHWDQIKSQLKIKIN